MTKPKDAKIWNEDLVRAMDARYHVSLTNGKRDVHMWQNAKQQIEHIRKDIYQYQNGRIVNLPMSLGKRVTLECEQIVRGVKNIYPDGYVPPTTTRATSNYGGVGDIDDHNFIDMEHPFAYPSPDSIVRTSTSSHRRNSDSVGVTTPTSSRQAATSQHLSNNTSADNPFLNAHYTKTIKIRGGAFSILMTFYHSTTDVLTKQQICNEGQKYCDEPMESNYMAGRTYGAWKSIDTLKQKHFVTEQGFATFTGGRFRDRPHQYTLTRDGKMFIDALLTLRPEAAQAAGIVVSSRADSSFVAKSVGGNSFHTGFEQPYSFKSGSISTKKNPSKLEEEDRTRLEEWIVNAQVGKSIEFKVGKERLKYLHDTCDELQSTYPGLLLNHGSSSHGMTGGGQQRRTLKIEMLSMPSSSSKMQLLSSSSLEMIHRNKKKRPISSLSSSREESYNSSSGKKQHTTLVVTPSSISNLKQHHLSPSQNAAIAAQRRLDKSKEKAKKQSANYILDLTYDLKEEENMIQKAIEQSLLTEETTNEIEDRRPRKRSRTNPHIEKGNNNMNNNSNEIDLSYPSGDGDDESEETIIEIDDNRQTTTTFNVPVTATSLPSTYINVNDFTCSNSTEVICIDEPLKYSKTEPSRHPKRQRHLSTAKYLVNDDNKCICIDEPLQPKEHQQLYGQRHSFKILIDNRERNRNATPRTLRLELERHLCSGSLKAVLPLSMSRSLRPQVEEQILSYGDFAFELLLSESKDNCSNVPAIPLDICIERKRVFDLVQRSASGDHLKQLYQMMKHSSLSILLIEYDLKVANLTTPYKTPSYRFERGFDPFDPSITNEKDIHFLFGRLVCMVGKKSCPIKLIQTKDEQSTLRAVGAMGLMASFYEAEKKQNTSSINEDGTIIVKKQNSNKGSANDDSVQDLTDTLSKGGIPWQLARRISMIVGGRRSLMLLYDRCQSEEVKIQLCSHMFHDLCTNNDLDFNGSAIEWSETIYRIVSAPTTSLTLSENQTTDGRGALLLYKDVITNQAKFLNLLYQEKSVDKVLDIVLTNSVTDKKLSYSPKCDSDQRRLVHIELSEKQAECYFSTSSFDDDDDENDQKDSDQAFYKLHIVKNNVSAIVADDSTALRQIEHPPILMKAVAGSCYSKEICLFEVEGFELLQYILRIWDDNYELDFGTLAQLISRHIDQKYSIRSNNKNPNNSSTSSSAGEGGGRRRVLLLCGLQAALDAVAKKSGYKLETKTVADMVLADLLLRTDITILQAQNKKVETRINIVQQIALACYYFAFLTET